MSVENILSSVEKSFTKIPLSLMEVWGRFGFMLGLALMFLAYTGIQFNFSGKFKIYRAKNIWDSKTLLGLIFTFSGIILAGFLGSRVVLVPEAQTLESLKDLVVFVSLVTLGYPALFIIPLAYGISDLIEGVPFQFIMDWLIGYFINPACFWIALQILGKYPDFRKREIWYRYLIFVVIFLFIEPPLWGYLCSENFTPEIAFRSITPSIFFTTFITWTLAPFIMLLFLPFMKRFFGIGPNKESPSEVHGIPIILMIAGPIIALMILMVASTAYITIRSGEKESRFLIGELHSRVAGNMEFELKEYFTQNLSIWQNKKKIIHMLKEMRITPQGRSFIIDAKGKVLVSPGVKDDPIILKSLIYLQEKISLREIRTPIEMDFSVITSRPLSKNTWNMHVTPIKNPHNGSHFYLVMIVPSSFYFREIHTSGTHSAMILALFLIVALGLIGLFTIVLTRPLQNIVNTSQSIIRGNWNQLVPRSKLLEFDTLSLAFNQMTHEMNKNYDEIQKAQFKAEASDRAKTQFIDLAAHELKTPLTPITLLIQKLKREEGRNPKLIDDISSSFQRLQRLIENLLFSTRIENREVHLKKQIVNANLFIQQVLKEEERNYPQRKFLFDPYHLTMKLNIDVPKLKLVISNLIDNAAKYSPSHTPIRLKLQQSETENFILIIDEGLGFKQDLKLPGLGLGLHICRAVMTMHGGKIQWDFSTGMTMKILLPRENL